MPQQEHGYYHQLTVPGKCKHILANGEPCGEPFIGPRVQKYCAAHQMAEKRVKRNRANRRERAVARIARKVQLKGGVMNQNALLDIAQFRSMEPAFRTDHQVYAAAKTVPGFPVVRIGRRMFIDSGRWAEFKAKGGSAFAGGWKKEHPLDYLD
jgi:hypothetical protein